jgi:hypothetical protein
VTGEFDSLALEPEQKNTGSPDSPYPEPGSYEEGETVTLRKQEPDVMPEDVLNLWVAVSSDPESPDDVETLLNRIEGLKDVKQAHAAPSVAKLDIYLRDIAKSLEIEDFQTDDPNDHINTLIEAEITELKDKVHDQETHNEKLYGWAMRLHQMSGRGDTPVQRACRDMSEQIGILIGKDFQQCPQTGRDTEAPFLDFIQPVVASPDGPDIGIWMEDPEDAEEIEQVAVVSEFLKGVDRSKRMRR